MEAGLGRGGIEAGLGREPPPPLAAGRWPLGVMPNGLLPPLRGGRGPGRLAPGAGVAEGVGRPAAGEPGRGGTAPGPGLGLGRVAPSAGGSRRAVSRCLAACWAALTASAWSRFSRAARSSAAATSMSWALAGFATGAGWAGPGRGPLGRAVGPGAGAGVADRRGGAGRAETFWGAGAGAAGAADEAAGADWAAGAAAGACDCAANAPRSRRATGASTVLDADLTNSPISFSLASTVLLSTPSSFASSCTRALPATALLTPRSCGRHPQRPHSCT
jgi:hypothetical protein